MEHMKIAYSISTYAAYSKPLFLCMLVRSFTLIFYNKCHYTWMIYQIAVVYVELDSSGCCAPSAPGLSVAVYVMVFRMSHIRKYCKKVLHRFGKRLQYCSS